MHDQYARVRQQISRIGKSTYGPFFLVVAILIGATLIWTLAALSRDNSPLPAHQNTTMNRMNTPQHLPMQASAANVTAEQAGATVCAVAPFYNGGGILILETSDQQKLLVTSSDRLPQLWFGDVVDVEFWLGGEGPNVLKDITRTGAKGSIDCYEALYK